MCSIVGIPRPFIQTTYDIEVVVALAGYRFIVTVQAVHAGLHYASEHAEHARTSDSPLLRLTTLPALLALFALLARLPRLRVLHTFHQVSQKLVRILLASQFELGYSGGTFLKMDLRCCIMELGAYRLAWRVAAKTASSSQKQHHWCCWRRRQEGE